MLHTFRDIEVQSWPFGIVSRYKIGKEWDRLYGADVACRWTINDNPIARMLSCTSANVIRHSNRATNFSKNGLALPNFES